MEPGWNLVELSIGDAGRVRTRPLAFDESGRVRWVLKLDYTDAGAQPVRESVNGNILTAISDVVYEFNRLGRNVRQIQLVGYSAHHEVLEIKQGPRTGNLLVAVDETGASTQEDRILELNRASGRIVNKWDLTQILDPTRNVLVNNSFDWLHNNAIEYSPGDDTIIISGRNQGVAKIDQLGKLVWLLAPHRAWQGAQAARLLTAVDSNGAPYSDAVQDGADNVVNGVEFDWPWGQHSPILLPAGDIALFDNGFNRHFDPANTNFSRAVIYRVDENAMTVRQLWEYGAVRGVEYYSRIISSVNFLPRTGHLLIQPGITGPAGGLGSAAIVSEVATDGAPLFEARVIFANRNPGTGAFDLSYRAHRITW
jgi:arylsulfate sulfotransferase